MLMQNIMYPFTLDAHSINNLTHLDSSIIYYHIMDFINDFWSSSSLKVVGGSSLRTSRTFSVTRAHMATPKHLKPFINCSNRRNHTTSSIQTNAKYREIDLAEIW
ncbi:uncharacterized protein LOC112552230 [Pogonomyrmex barbatus]|uniref:Uncharacterized protein LOC112552230 n=1 Tax=Pogonomyrmex barbatus TaxID=144034 RepID=A0A8N1S2K6_9HYME|nr:uncharacterized protein LOC112552230 [Pogonomyrmex barbatus]